MSAKVLLLYLVVLFNHSKASIEQNYISRLPLISHCREILVRNYMSERIPSVITEILCEMREDYENCGFNSKVSFQSGLHFYATNVLLAVHSTFLRN